MTMNNAWRRALIARVAVTVGLLTALAASPAPAFAAAGGGVTGAPAYAVELDRTGGFAGVHDHYLAVPRQPDTTEIFEIVNSAEFKALKKEYLPEIRCCDFFHYLVTVRYADRTVKTVATMDSGDAPEPLWKLIRLLGQLPES